MLEYGCVCTYVGSRPFSMGTRQEFVVIQLTREIIVEALKECVYIFLTCFQSGEHISWGSSWYKGK